MEDPPSKRQRLSPERVTASNSASNDGNPITNSTANPTTPTRRRSSHASPTKSSLARSHPDILRLSPTKRYSESRGRLLRQELLGSHGQEDAFYPVQKSTQSAVPVQTAASVQQDIRPADATTEVANTSDKPQTDSNAIQGEGPATIEQPHSDIRPPLGSRQPRQRANINPRYLEDTDTISKPIVPKLVERASSGPGSTSASQAGELELPPTPVQLGLVSAPDRPRGLASSSSGGPGSGSGRNRRRVRNFNSMMTSSPLKPRRHRDISPDPTTEITHTEDMAQEAQESDLEQDPEDITAQADFIIRQKTAELAQLQLQLTQCAEDLTRLETLAEALEQNTMAAIDPKTASILLPDTITKPASPTDIIQPPTLAHLTLFAPGNLQLAHTTSTRRINQCHKSLQKLTITAPQPWQADTFNLTFEIFIDAETATIDSIVQNRSGHLARHIALQRWIEQRLDSPLHKIDVSGIIWGAGMYFEESVRRARVLRRLLALYKSGGEDKDYEVEQDFGVDDEHDAEKTKEVILKKLTMTEARILSPYLELNGVTLTSRSSISGASSPSAIKRQMYLSYDLILSWTGTISVHVDISVTGVGVGAERSAKELFRKLLVQNGARNVVRAVREVWGILGF